VYVKPCIFSLPRYPQAGGKGSDGTTNILGIPVTKLHQRLPFFAGSPEDIQELEGYKDVQQIGTKKYNV
jgi:fructose-1,6-bisphosphatase I